MHLEALWPEIRQAARVLGRARGHTLAIVILLALGIGANSAMFSLVNAIYIRELAVREPSRLVTVNPGWSIPSFDDFRRMLDGKVLRLARLIRQRKIAAAQSCERDNAANNKAPWPCHDVPPSSNPTAGFLAG